MPGYEAKFVNTLLKRHECPICLFAMRNPVQTECGHLFCKDCLEPVLKRRQPICPLDKTDITPGGRHECPICLFAMRNPVQTECGHLFCKDCLEPVLKRRQPICPLDKTDITPGGIFPDNACRREILNLDVYCNFMTSGCTWIGQLKALELHVESCEYRKVQCTQCGQYIQQLVLIKHREVDCPMRPELCPRCKEEVPLLQMQAHVDKVCLEVLHPCPNGCNSPEMKLPELERHLAIKGGDCSHSEVNCPFKPYGCSFVSIRKNIPTHLEQYSVFHCQLQAECFVELKQQAEKNTAATQHLLERVGSLETRLNAVERLQDALEQRVELLDDRREMHSDRYAGRIDVVEDQTARLASTMAQLQKQLDETRVSTVNSSGWSSGFESESRFSSLGHLSGITPRRIETIHSKVTELEHSVDRCLNSSMDHGLRLQLLERATYNGILVWKIDEFERRRKESVDGITMSLYSSPFYTSRHGYKMCARIYLNGDGLGKNTHFSFFFVIMRGPYDPLLPWPFRQKVTLTLLNQTGKKHVTDHFRPDPHSSSFQRPGNKREMNIASGCPMFIRIEHLLSGGFVKDDAAYIRVVVDTSDLPQSVPLQLS